MERTRPNVASDRAHVITIPGSDRVFQDHVLGVAATATTPHELEQRLRRIFPLVIVRERPITGMPAWYVYRDGRWRPHDGEWWDDPSLPRVTVSPDGWMLQANATAAGLLEFEPGQVREHHFTDFVVPGTLQDALALFRLIERGHPLDATIRLRPRSGDTVAVEMHSHREDDHVVGVFRLAAEVGSVTVDDVVVPRPVSVTTLPAADVAFRAYVLRALDRMSEPTPDGLDLRVRRLYPHASTTAEGDRWTTTRDPAAPDGDASAWWEDPSLPRVRTDRRGLIVEADPGADSLLGRPLVGRHWQELVLPGTTDDVAEMLEILAEVGSAVSRFRMPRADGTLVEFDSHTRALGEDLVTTFRVAAPDGPAETS